MATSDSPYQVLDTATQQSLIKQRIRDLETAQLQLELRIEAPAPGDVITQQDHDNLQTCKDSLATLYGMLSG